MAARPLAVVAAVAIAGAVAWFALRSSGDGGSDATKSRGSGALTHEHTVRSRPTLAPSQPPGTPAQIYASEVRDDTWAAQTEAELGRRFQAIRGAKLESIDCRETRCAITVAGSELDIRKTIADLASDRGLHGYAENVLLSPPEKRADGAIVLRVIASFRH